MDHKFTGKGFAVVAANLKMSNMSCLLSVTAHHIFLGVPFFLPLQPLTTLITR